MCLMLIKYDEICDFFLAEKNEFHDFLNALVLFLLMMFLNDELLLHIILS